MIAFLSIFYGFNIVVLIYLFSYLGARGIVGSGGIPSYLVAGKYLVYWQVIAFGFKFLPAWGILSGLTGGIYLSLPLMVFLNKNLQQPPPAASLKVVQIHPIRRESQVV